MNTTQEKNSPAKTKTPKGADPALSVGLSNFSSCYANMEISEDMQQIRLFGSPWVKFGDISIRPHYHGSDGIHIRLLTMEDLEIWGAFFGEKVVLKTDVSEHGFNNYGLENKDKTWTDEGKKINPMPTIFAFIHTK